MGDQVCEECPEKEPSVGYRGGIYAMTFVLFLVTAYALVFRPFGSGFEELLWQRLVPCWFSPGIDLEGA